MCVFRQLLIFFICALCSLPTLAVRTTEAVKAQEPDLLKAVETIASLAVIPEAAAAEVPPEKAVKEEPVTTEEPSPTAPIEASTPEIPVEAQASPTPTPEETPVEVATEEPPPETSPTPLSIPNLLPAIYADIGWQGSFAEIKEVSGGSSLTVNSTQLTSVSGKVGGWLPNSSWGLSLAIHSFAFNVPQIPIDNRYARHLNVILNGLYAFMISDNFAFTPGFGIAYRQQPYIFVQSGTSTFLTSLTMIDVRLGPEIMFRLDPNHALNFGAFVEYPLITSTESGFSIGQYQWKMLTGVEGAIAYHFLPWLDAGVGGGLMYHNYQLTISKSGVAAANNRATTWLSLNGGLFVRGRF